MLDVVSGPKRHHYVPRNYLERFANGDQVFVRRRDGSTFTANCINVAVESGFYDIELAGGAKSKQVEDVLADIEGTTADVFRTIDHTMAAPPPDADEREILSVYLALQMTRTPEQRERTLFPERLATYLDGRPLTRELVGEYLESRHLGFAPSDNEVGAAFDFASVALRDPSVLTPEFSMQLMLRSVSELAPRLAKLEWCVEHDRKERFIMLREARDALFEWRWADAVEAAQSCLAAKPTDTQRLEALNILACARYHEVTRQTAAAGASARRRVGRTRGRRGHRGRTRGPRWRGALASGGSRSRSRDRG